jgi:hypothetical protein
MNPVMAKLTFPIGWGKLAGEYSNLVKAIFFDWDDFETRGRIDAII